MKSKLNGVNLICGVNSWAVSLLKYLAAFVRWRKSELQAIDRKTRKLLLQSWQSCDIGNKTHLNQRVPMETILSSGLKEVCHVLLTNFSLEVLQCNCAINFDDFSILATDCNKFKLRLRGSLLIKRDKPILNRTIKSFPLELFD